jgi:hypothetical protein
MRIFEEERRIRGEDCERRRMRLEEGKRNRRRKSRI